MTRIQDLIRDDILDAIAEWNDDKLLMHVRTRYEPEDVFRPAQLDQWALRNGFVQAVKQPLAASEPDFVCAIDEQKWTGHI